MRRSLVVIVVGLSCSAGCATSTRARTAPTESLQTFRELVTLQGGVHPTEWHRQMLDAVGRERLLVWLQPRIAVEGGTVAFELGLSHPSARSYGNLLGEAPAFDEGCRCYPESPFEVYVRYASGELASRFGSVRRFAIPSAKEELVLEVVNVEIGRGVGDCDSCEHIERLIARISVERP